MQADRTADAEGGRLVAIQDGIASAKGPRAVRALRAYACEGKASPGKTGSQAGAKFHLPGKDNTSRCRFPMEQISYCERARCGL